MDGWGTSDEEEEGGEKDKEQEYDVDEGMRWGRALTGLLWRLREMTRKWLGTPWGPAGVMKTGLERGLERIGLRGARPDLVPSCLARERRGLLPPHPLPLLRGDKGASRSSSRWVSASFC